VDDIIKNDYEVDLSVDLGPLHMDYPLMVGSGGLSYLPVFKRLHEMGCKLGGVVLKGINYDGLPGNPNPTVYRNSNAVGLSNQGVEALQKELEEFFPYFQDNNIPVIVQVFTKEDEREIARVIKYINDHGPLCDAFEINGSCPHVSGVCVSKDPAKTGDYIRAGKDSTDVPIIYKVTPNTDRVKEVAVATARAGADMWSGVNTFGPGMYVNLDAIRPVLANRFGGFSGEAIKPIALKCVYDAYDALHDPKNEIDREVPMIGMGGIGNGRDAAEFIAAGADAVAFVNCLEGKDDQGVVDLFDKMIIELSDIMIKHDYKNPADLKGCLHGR
jgi:dihydroorotate dehydrogenase (NAD+) catalytic subunit